MTAAISFKVGESVLPLVLTSRLAEVLKGYPRNILKPDVERLLDAYRSSCQIDYKHILSGRKDEGSIDPSRLPKIMLDYGEREVMAYLASQLPFTYGPIQRVLKEIQARVPSFRPQSLLDFGTGPGTAILSANEVWKESLKKIMAIDISEAMLLASRRLLADLDPSTRLEFKRFLPLTFPTKSDLTMAAFVLSELPDDGVRKMSVKALWRQTSDMMVLVDRGTPEGFRVLAEARKQILAGAGYLDAEGETVARPRLTELVHVVAPCPHEKRCPMVGSWCHFSQRIQLTKFQMETNPIAKGFEDQKFSYLVLRRGERPGLREDHELASAGEQSFHWPRIIRRPLKRGGHIINDVCDTDSSFKRIIVPKSQGKDIYHEARKAKWGDLWPHPPKNEPRVISTMAVKPGKKRH